MKKRISRPSRGLAATLLISFFATNLFQQPLHAYSEASQASITANHGSSSQAGKAGFPKFPASITLPSELGILEEAHQGQSAEWVILVQDAHAIPQAQRNIQKIIQYFQEQYGLDYVGIEGAALTLDAQLFQSFPDQKRLKEVLEDYFEAGELTGSTAAAIFPPHAGGGNRTVFQGIEEWPLYEEGLGLYLYAAEREKALLKRITGLKKELQQRKETVYSRELYELDRKLEGFRENELEFVELLKVLLKIRKPGEGTELALLAGQMKREGKGSPAIEREVRRMGEALKGIVEKAGQSTHEFNLKHQEFLTSHITTAQFALYLKETADRMALEGAGKDANQWFEKIQGIQKGLSGNEPLNALIKDARRMRDLEGTELFIELEGYINSVKEKLFRTEAERALDRQGRRLDLTEKLVKLEMSRAEWEEWEGESLEARPVEHEALSAHAAFYENALKREVAFYGHLMEGLRSRKEEARSAMIIAGGFHTEGLTAELKQKGVSYAVIRPAIEQIPEDSIYRQQMRGQVSWKEYLRMERGRMNLYEAFVRGLRDRLLNNGESGISNLKSIQNSQFRTQHLLLKHWRDQIIVDLAAKREIEKSGEYTKFLDEVAQEDIDDQEGPGFKSRPRWLAKVERFISGLRRLEERNALTEKNVLRLFRPATIPPRVTANALVPGAYGISEVSLKENAARQLAGPALQETKATGARFELRADRTDKREAAIGEDPLQKAAEGGAFVGKRIIPPEELIARREALENMLSDKKEINNGEKLKSLVQIILRKNFKSWFPDFHSEEDAVSHAILDIRSNRINILRSYDPAVSSPFNYLGWRIARRLKDQYSRNLRSSKQMKRSTDMQGKNDKKPRIEDSALSGEINPLDSMILTEGQILLAMHKSLLSEQELKVYEMTEKGWTLDAISRQTGIHLSTVKKAAADGKRKVEAGVKTENGHELALMRAIQQLASELEKKIVVGVLSGKNSREIAQELKIEDAVLRRQWIAPIFEKLKAKHPGHLKTLALISEKNRRDRRKKELRQWQARPEIRALSTEDIAFVQAIEKLNPDVRDDIRVLHVLRKLFMPRARDSRRLFTRRILSMPELKINLPLFQIPENEVLRLRKEIAQKDREQLSSETTRRLILLKRIHDQKHDKKLHGIFLDLLSRDKAGNFMNPHFVRNLREIATTAHEDDGFPLLALDLFGQKLGLSPAYEAFVYTRLNSAFLSLTDAKKDLFFKVDYVRDLVFDWAEQGFSDRILEGLEKNPGIKLFILPGQIWAIDRAAGRRSEARQAPRKSAVPETSVSGRSEARQAPRKSAVPETWVSGRSEVRSAPEPEKEWPEMKYHQARYDQSEDMETKMVAVDAIFSGLLARPEVNRAEILRFLLDRYLDTMEMPLEAKLLYTLAALGFHNADIRSLLMTLLDSDETLPHFLLEILAGLRTFVVRAEEGLIASLDWETAAAQAKRLVLHPRQKLIQGAMSLINGLSVERVKDNKPVLIDLNRLNQDALFKNRVLELYERSGHPGIEMLAMDLLFLLDPELKSREQEKKGSPEEPELPENTEEILARFLQHDKKGYPRLDENQMEELYRLIHTEGSLPREFLKNLFEEGKQVVFLADLSTRGRSLPALTNDILALKDIHVTHVALPFPASEAQKLNAFIQGDIGPEKWSYSHTGTLQEADDAEDLAELELLRQFLAQLEPHFKFIFYENDNTVSNEGELGADARILPIEQVLRANPRARILAIGFFMETAKENLMEADGNFVLSLAHELGKRIDPVRIAAVYDSDEENWQLAGMQGFNNLADFAEQFSIPTSFAIQTQNTPLGRLRFDRFVNTFATAWDGIIFRKENGNEDPHFFTRPEAPDSAPLSDVGERRRPAGTSGKRSELRLPKKMDAFEIAMRAQFKSLFEEYTAFSAGIRGEVMVRERVIPEADPVRVEELSLKVDGMRQKMEELLPDLKPTRKQSFQKAIREMDQISAAFDQFLEGVPRRTKVTFTAEDQTHPDILRLNRKIEQAASLKAFQEIDDEIFNLGPRSKAVIQADPQAALYKRAERTRLVWILRQLAAMRKELKILGKAVSGGPSEIKTARLRVGQIRMELESYHALLSRQIDESHVYDRRAESVRLIFAKVMARIRSLEGFLSNPPNIEFSSKPGPQSFTGRSAAGHKGKQEPESADKQSPKVPFEKAKGNTEGKRSELRAADPNAYPMSSVVEIAGMRGTERIRLELPPRVAREVIGKTTWNFSGAEGASKIGKGYQAYQKAWKDKTAHPLTLFHVEKDEAAAQNLFHWAVENYSSASFEPLRNSIPGFAADLPQHILRYFVDMLWRDEAVTLDFNPNAFLEEQGYFLIRWLILMERLSHRPSEDQAARNHLNLLIDIYQILLDYFETQSQTEVLPDSPKAFYEKRLRDVVQPGRHPELGQAVDRLLREWDAWTRAGQIVTAKYLSELQVLQMNAFESEPPATGMERAEMRNEEWRMYEEHLSQMIEQVTQKPFGDGGRIYAEASSILEHLKSNPKRAWLRAEDFLNQHRNGRASPYSGGPLVNTRKWTSITLKETEKIAIGRYLQLKVRSIYSFLDSQTSRERTLAKFGLEVAPGTQVRGSNKKGDQLIATRGQGDQILFKGDRWMSLVYIRKIEPSGKVYLLVNTPRHWEVSPSRAELRAQPETALTGPESEIVLEIVRLVEKLNSRGIKPFVHGTDLLVFGDQGGDLLRFIRRFSVLKNPYDIRNILLWRLHLESPKRIPLSGIKPETAKLLYDSIFNQREFANQFLKLKNRPLNIVLFRRGESGRELTQLIKTFPDANIKVILSGTDDGLSWFHGAREFKAPGIPGAGKALLDLAGNRHVKEFLQARLKGEHQPDEELEQAVTGLIMKLANPKDRDIRLTDEMEFHFEQAMRIEVGKRMELSRYLSRFLDMLLDHRRRYPESRFSLRNVPLRSLALLGASLILKEQGKPDHWQGAIEAVGRLLNVREGNQVVLTTPERQHVVALRRDGTIYFSETGINQYETESPMAGLWLVNRTVDGAYIREIEETLRNRREPIELMPADIPAGRFPDVVRDEIAETTRKADPRHVAEIAEEFSRRSTTAGSAADEIRISPAAEAILKSADAILYSSAWLESRIGSALVVPGVREAIAQNTQAVKINLTEISGMNPAKNTVLDYLTRIYRYLGISNPASGDSQDAPAVDFVLGGLLGDQDPEILRNHFLEVEEMTGGRVRGVGLKADTHEEFGFYSSTVLGEAMIALTGLHMAGFSVSDSQGLLEGHRQPPDPGKASRRLGLFREDADVKVLIRELKANWPRIIKKGAFAFDVDMTILPKGAQELTDYSELAYLFMRLLREGVRVAIISGNSYEEQGKRIFEAIKREMQDDPSALERLTFYVSGGATKYAFDDAGNKMPDLAYNTRHAMDLTDIKPAIDSALREFAARRFGLEEALRDQFVGEAQKDRKVALQAPWMKGDRYQPEWITPEALENRQEIPFPWVEKRGEFAVEEAGSTVMRLASLTIKPTPRFEAAGKTIDVRDELQNLIRQKLGGAHTGFGIRSGGSSSTDITSNLANKTAALKDLIESRSLDAGWVFYFGDEFYERTRSKGRQIGNDEVIARDPELAAVRTLAVNEKDMTGAVQKTLWVGRTPQATFEFLEEILTSRAQSARFAGATRRRSEIRQGSRKFAVPESWDSGRSEFREERNRAERKVDRRAFLTALTGGFVTLFSEPWLARITADPNEGPIPEEKPGWKGRLSKYTLATEKLAETLQKPTLTGEDRRAKTDELLEIHAKATNEGLATRDMELFYEAIGNQLLKAETFDPEKIRKMTSILSNAGGGRGWHIARQKLSAASNQLIKIDLAAAADPKKTLQERYRILSHIWRYLRPRGEQIKRDFNQALMRLSNDIQSSLLDINQEGKFRLLLYNSMLMMWAQNTHARNILLHTFLETMKQETLEAGVRLIAAYRAGNAMFQPRTGFGGEITGDARVYISNDYREEGLRAMIHMFSDKKLRKALIEGENITADGLFYLLDAAFKEKDMQIVFHAQIPTMKEIIAAAAKEQGGEPIAEYFAELLKNLVKPEKLDKVLPFDPKRKPTEEELKLDPDEPSLGPEALAKVGFNPYPSQAPQPILPMGGIRDAVQNARKAERQKAVAQFIKAGMTDRLEAIKALMAAFKDANLSEIGPYAAEKLLEFLESELPGLPPFDLELLLQVHRKIEDSAWDAEHRWATREALSGWGTLDDPDSIYGEKYYKNKLPDILQWIKQYRSADQRNPQDLERLRLAFDFLVAGRFHRFYKLGFFELEDIVFGNTLSGAEAHLLTTELFWPRVSYKMRQPWRQAFEDLRPIAPEGKEAERGFRNYLWTAGKAILGAAWRADLPPDARLYMYTTVRNGMSYYHVDDPRLGPVEVQHSALLELTHLNLGLVVESMLLANDLSAVEEGARLIDRSELPNISGLRRRQMRDAFLFHLKQDYRLAVRQNQPELKKKLLLTVQAAMKLELIGPKDLDELKALHEAIPKDLAEEFNKLKAKAEPPKLEPDPKEKIQENFFFRPNFRLLYQNLQSLRSKQDTQGRASSIEHRSEGRRDVSPGEWESLQGHQLLEFYAGIRKDHRGRTIFDIWKYNLNQLEQVHDYIQLLFPTTELGNVFGFTMMGEDIKKVVIPVLRQMEIEIFRGQTPAGHRLRTHMLKSLDLMLDFYGLEYGAEGEEIRIRPSSVFSLRMSNWLTPSNHNYLRITRILKSLRAAGLEKYAVELFLALDDINKKYQPVIGHSYDYWLEAVKGIESEPLSISEHENNLVVHSEKGDKLSERGRAEAREETLKAFVQYPAEPLVVEDDLNDEGYTFYVGPFVKLGEAKKNKLDEIFQSQLPRGGYFILADGNQRPLALGKSMIVETSEFEEVFHGNKDLQALHWETIDHDKREQQNTLLMEILPGPDSWNAAPNALGRAVVGLQKINEAMNQIILPKGLEDTRIKDLQIKNISKDQRTYEVQLTYLRSELRTETPQDEKPVEPKWADAINWESVLDKRVGPEIEKQGSARAALLQVLLAAIGERRFESESEFTKFLRGQNIKGLGQKALPKWLAVDAFEHLKSKQQLPGSGDKPSSAAASAESSMGTPIPQGEETAPTQAPSSEEMLLSQWLQDLRDYAYDYESQVVNKVPHTPEKEAADKAHFDLRSREIEQAIEIAPEGKPAVILGAGALRDIPDKIFTSRKFSKVILVDINEDLMREAVKQRGFESLLASGHITLVGTDLSLIHPQMVREIQSILQRAKKLDDVKKGLISLYKRLGKDVTLLRLPEGLQAHIKFQEAGLVISPALLPPVVYFLQFAIDRQIARHFGMKLPVQTNEALFHNFKHQDYMKAFLPVHHRFYETHAEFLSRLISEDGTVYISMNLGRVDVPRSMFYERDRMLKQIEKAFRELARLYAGLQSVMSQTDGRLVKQLFDEFQANPARARLQFGNPSGLVMNQLPSGGKENMWLRGMRVIDTNVWIWHDRPDLSLAELVQSLLVKPRSGSLAVLRKKIEAGSRPTAAEIYRALHDGLDRAKIEEEAARQGQGISPAEQAEHLEWRYGFTLNEDEVKRIFDALNLQPADQVLEIGSGHTVLSVIAALLGAKVTAIDPSKKYGTRLKSMVEQVRDLIKLAGGEFQFIERNILDSEIQQYMPPELFDHIIALDAVVPVEIERELRHLDKTGQLGITLEMGIMGESNIAKVAETMARVKKPQGGTVYVSLASSAASGTPEENIFKEALNQRGIAIERVSRVPTAYVTEASRERMRQPGHVDHAIIYHLSPRDSGQQTGSKSNTNQGRSEMRTDNKYQDLEWLEKKVEQFQRDLDQEDLLKLRQWVREVEVLLTEFRRHLAARPLQTEYGKKAEKLLSRLNANFAEAAARLKSEIKDLPEKVSLNLLALEQMKKQILKHFQSYVQTHNPQDVQLLREAVGKVNLRARQVMDWYQAFSEIANAVDPDYLNQTLLYAEREFSDEEKALFLQVNDWVLEIFIPGTDSAAVQRREQWRRVLSEMPKPSNLRQITEINLIAVEESWRHGVPAAPQQEYLTDMFKKSIARLSESGGMMIARGKHRDILIEPWQTASTMAVAYAHELTHVLLDEVDPLYSRVVSQGSGPADWVTTAIQMLVAARLKTLEVMRQDRGRFGLPVAGLNPYYVAAFEMGNEWGRERLNFDQKVSLIQGSLNYQLHLLDDVLVHRRGGNLNPGSRERLEPYLIGAVVGGLAYGKARWLAVQRGEPENESLIFKLAGEYVRQVSLGGAHQALGDALLRAEQELDSRSELRSLKIALEPLESIIIGDRVKLLLDQIGVGGAQIFVGAPEDVSISAEPPQRTIRHGGIQFFLRKQEQSILIQDGTDRISVRIYQWDYLEKNAPDSVTFEIKAPRDMSILYEEKYSEAKAMDLVTEMRLFVPDRSIERVQKPVGRHFKRQYRFSLEKVPGEILITQTDDNIEIVGYSLFPLNVSSGRPQVYQALNDILKIKSRESRENVKEKMLQRAWQAVEKIIERLDVVLTRKDKEHGYGLKLSFYSLIENISKYRGLYEAMAESLPGQPVSNDLTVIQKIADLIKVNFLQDTDKPFVVVPKEQIAFVLQQIAEINAVTPFPVGLRTIEILSSAISQAKATAPQAAGQEPSATAGVKGISKKRPQIHSSKMREEAVSTLNSLIDKLPDAAAYHELLVDGWISPQLRAQVLYQRMLDDMPYRELAVQLMVELAKRSNKVTGYLVGTVKDNAFEPLLAEILTAIAKSGSPLPEKFLEFAMMNKPEVAEGARKLLSQIRAELRGTVQSEHQEKITEVELKHAAAAVIDAIGQSEIPAGRLNHTARVIVQTGVEDFARALRSEVRQKIVELETRLSSPSQNKILVTPELVEKATAWLTHVLIQKVKGTLGIAFDIPEQVAYLEQALGREGVRKKIGLALLTKRMREVRVAGLNYEVLGDLAVYRPRAALDNARSLPLVIDKRNAVKASPYTFEVRFDGEAKKGEPFFGVVAEVARTVAGLLTADKIRNADELRHSPRRAQIQAELLKDLFEDFKDFNKEGFIQFDAEGNLSISRTLLFTFVTEYLAQTEILKSA